MALNYDIAIVIAVFIFIALAFLWLGTLVYKNPTFDPYVNVDNNVVYRQCLPGQCAVNIYSGVKSCPSDSTTLAKAAIGSEVCSSKYVCDNPSNPFAVDDRGIALGGRICPTGVACQCLSNLYCGNNVMSYFSPFWSTQDILVKYGQSTQVVDALSTIHTTPPYLIQQGAGECTLQPERYANGSMEPATCLSGTLAYFPNSSAAVDGLTTSLACMRGKPCGTGFTPVWNNSIEKIDCVNNVPNSVFV